VGIEIDVEPSGDQEIQEYQNLDKQELINLLMRAKSALGGRVPSPPMTPSTPAESDTGVPRAVDVPSRPYSKYNLPPLRPIPNGNQSRGGGGVATTPKAEDANKENEGNWNPTGGNSNDWNNNGPSNEAAWGAGGGNGN